MSGSVFAADGSRWVPGELARGPWDPQALHGGAPAALIAEAFERHEPQEGLEVARLGFDFLRPIPFAPLTVEVQTVRAGRRVQELAAELHASGEQGARTLVGRARALRVARLPPDLGELPADPPGHEPLPGPQEAKPFTFALGDATATSFASSAMEMRWVSDPWALGRGRLWQRLRPALLDGRDAGALARVAATADFANGVGAALSFEQFIFINADLTIHLQRLPRGEWIGIDARTLLPDGGTGLSDAVLFDEQGPIGRSFQSLVVARR